MSIALSAVPKVAIGVNPYLNSDPESTTKNSTIELHSIHQHDRDLKVPVYVLPGYQNQWRGRSEAASRFAVAYILFTLRQVFRRGLEYGNYPSEVFILAF